MLSCLSLKQLVSENRRPFRIINQILVIGIFGDIWNYFISSFLNICIVAYGAINSHHYKHKYL
jgi:hypothetical protein